MEQTLGRREIDESWKQSAKLVVCGELVAVREKESEISPHQ